MDTKDLISEVISLPVEERMQVVETVLKSLNVPSSDIDKKWASLAKERLFDLKSGKVKGRDGEEVFNNIWDRLS